MLNSKVRFKNTKCNLLILRKINKTPYTYKISVFCNINTMWLPFFITISSNDFQNGFFTIMNWDLNSLSKHNFQRVHLIEAHNAIFSSDIRKQLI